MNLIDAIVTAVERADRITVVSFEAAGQPMRMMSLELDPSLVPGSSVVLGAKASHISIAKPLKGELSISNQLYVTIESIRTGELLSSITFDFAGSRLESIITRDSALRMRLQAGDHVVALIKSSELSILKTRS